MQGCFESSLVSWRQDFEQAERYAQYQNDFNMAMELAARGQAIVSSLHTVAVGDFNDFNGFTKDEGLRQRTLQSQGTEANDHNGRERANGTGTSAAGKWP